MPDYDVHSGEKGDSPRGSGMRLGGDSGSRMTGRLVFGLVVLTLGVLWTLDNLNILESEPILRWWPVVLVAFGLSKVLGLTGPASPVSGTVFTVVGLVLLGNEFELLNVRLWHLWPLALIALGFSLVVRSLRGPAAPVGVGDRHDVVHSFTMMGGLNLKNESQQFRGGDLSAVMGGVELDLRSARAVGPQVVIDAFAWWGGIDIFVPKDWKVVTEVLPLMAGYEDNSKAPEGEAKTTLVIRGVVIMGGIEVKN